MPTFDNNTTSLLAQIPLLGAFIVGLGLVLYFFRDWMNAERKKTQEEAAAERKKNQDEAAAEREVKLKIAEVDAQARAEEGKRQRDWWSIQNELFLQAIKDDREAYTELRDEIKALTKVVMELSNLLITHDAKTSTKSRS